MHVKAKIGHASGTFLIDTGSSDTILSARMFYALPAEVKPVLKPVSVTSEQADGTPLSVMGCVDMEIEVGHARVTLSVTVADIKNTGIIGMDFLEAADCKIDIKNRTLVMNDVTVPCLDSNSRNFCARITIRETVSIPAMHEAIIPGQIKESRELVYGESLIEPIMQSKMSDTGAMLARAVVDMDAASSSVPLRMYNPTSNTITLPKGTVIGKLTPVMECEPISAENEDRRMDDSDVPAHLQDLYERSIKELPQEQHSNIAELLVEFKDVFSTGDDDIGKTGIIKHRIDTGNSPPIRQKPRRLAPSLQAEADKQVQDMLTRGFIEPSASPWASPIVLVTKKDGSKRFCIDYRRLNDATIKDSYPIPRIEESLDSLAGAQWFSTLDLASGYWQVELDESAKEKSAFVMRGGLYQWTVMPFGLCNAPSTFERLMENIMCGLQWESLLVYLDDVIIFGKTIEEEMSRMREVFRRLRQAHLKLKPKKCMLFQKSVLYLGHVVTPDGIATNPEKIRDIVDWPIPTCVKDVRSFLGLASYYRRYVKGFCEFAKPLHDLTRKSVVFHWTSECEEAFYALKQCLTTSPVLAYPNNSGKFILDTDASSYGIGAVLSQEQDGKERVIAYASRTQSKTERNYCVTRKELLAVVFFVKKFRPYLYGRRFLIRTDHGSLRWLLNFKNPEGQVARWIQILGEYDYEIIHRPGRNHQNADSLSRKTCPQCSRDEDGRKTGELDSKPVSKMKHKVAYMDQSSQTSTKDMSMEETTDVVNQEPPELPGFKQSQKAAKSVKWKEEDDLVEIRYFESDPAERVNVSKLHDYFEGTGKYGGRVDPWSQLDCATSVDESRQPRNPRTMEVQKTSIQVKTIRTASKWTGEDMRAAQRSDTDLSYLITAKEAGQRPNFKEVSSMSKAAKVYYLEWDRLELREEVLYRRWESDDGKTIKWQLIIPDKYKDSVLEELHDSKSAAHLGVTKTRNKIRDRFYWYGYTTDIRSWIRRCDICSRRKSPSTRRRAKLQQDVAGHTGQRIAMDILGPLPITPSGNRFILVIGDYFSKWIEAYPIPNQEATTCADRLTQEWICRHGCPTMLHSDQGRNFESKVMAEVCKLLGIEKTRTTPLHPQSDGFIERFNRTMMDTVSVLLDPHRHQQDWDEVLPYALMAYRSSTQESTGETPHAMLYGEEMKLPIDISSAPSDHREDEDHSTDYVQELRRKLKCNHERAREVLKQAAKRQKRNHDRNVILHPVSEGTFVWLHNEVRKKGQCPKLQFKWDGPFIVTKKLSDVVFRIQKSPQSKPKVVHYDRLKPYEGKELQSWLVD